MKNELTEIPLMGHSTALYQSMGFTLHKKLNQTDFLNGEKRGEEAGERKPGTFAQIEKIP